MIKLKKREETKRVPAPIVSQMVQELKEVGGEAEETPDQYLERIKQEAKSKLGKRTNPFKITLPTGEELKRRKEEHRASSLDRLHAQIEEN